jgi:hypothetical protein
VIRFKGLVITSQKKKQKKKKAPGIKAGGAGVSRFLKKKFCPETSIEPVSVSVTRLSGTMPDQNFFFKTEGLILTRPRAGMCGARLNFVLLF